MYIPLFACSNKNIIEMHENKKMKIFIFIGTWLIIMYAPENVIYIICVATNNDNFLLVIVYYYSG